MCSTCLLNLCVYDSVCICHIQSLHLLVACAHVYILSHTDTEVKQTCNTCVQRYMYVYTEHTGTIHMRYTR